jgi:hypothetical protein
MIIDTKALRARCEAATGLAEAIDIAREHREYNAWHHKHVVVQAGRLNELAGLLPPMKETP